MSFNSIFQNSSASLTFQGMLVCTAVSLLMGMVIAFCHYWTGRTTKNFLVSLAIMPALVQAVVMLVNGNLGTGVAIVGAFSLIRFRSVPGSSRDICSIFFAMAVGVATGTGNVSFAVFMTVAIAAVILAAYKLPVGNRHEKGRSLKITIYENLDYSTVFDDLFDKYLRKCELESVRTTNMGSMYQLHYIIEMNSEKEEKEFIDALRVRNGNLTISCGKIDTTDEQL